MRFGVLPSTGKVLAKYWQSASLRNTESQSATGSAMRGSRPLQAILNFVNQRMYVGIPGFCRTLQRCTRIPYALHNPTAPPHTDPGALTFGKAAGGLRPLQGSLICCIKQLMT